jgi:hypothetical protein
MKKVITWFILVSFINLTGCYSRDLIAPSTYKFDEKKNITVITKDTTYKFRGFQYILVNDTLIGTKGNFLPDKSALNESSIKVPVEEMQLVEVTSTDAGKTITLIVGVAAVLYLVITLTTYATIGNIFSF